MIKVKKDLAPYFILVGNKADQDRERQVSFEKGRERAAEFGCDFMETSAKTAHNIDKLFVTVVRKLREQYGNSTVTELPSHFAGTRMAGAGKPYKKPGKPGRGCVIV
jgi:GTPase SAR1 family protein